MEARRFVRSSIAQARALGYEVSPSLRRPIRTLCFVAETTSSTGACAFTCSRQSRDSQRFGLVRSRDLPRASGRSFGRSELWRNSTLADHARMIWWSDAQSEDLDELGRISIGGTPAAGG